MLKKKRKEDPNYEVTHSAIKETRAGPASPESGLGAEKLSNCWAHFSHEKRLSDFRCCSCSAQAGPLFNFLFSWEDPPLSIPTPSTKSIGAAPASCHNAHFAHFARLSFALFAPSFLKLDAFATVFYARTLGIGRLPAPLRLPPRYSVQGQVARAR